MEFPIGAARFPNRNDPDIRSALGINGRPQVAVTGSSAFDRSESNSGLNSLPHRA